jgi:squalene cyclase
MGVLLLVSAAGLFDGAATPEGRALAYLAREVPAWSVENKCYSCHNNGDAARALFTAVHLGRPLPRASLTSTLDWLQRPRDWEHNGGDTPNNDRLLASIQFAAALSVAVETGLIEDAVPLRKAAELVAERQNKDGCWQPEGERIGSPATYGPVLATYLARRTLRLADAEKYRDAIRRADEWLINLPVKNVVEAAAVLWALEDADGEAVAAQRKRCLEVLRKGQGEDGGWGPYITSPSEPFDTALVILSLQQFAKDDEIREMIKGGRRFLVRIQNADGSWTETTRPAGSTSYAQRVSTTGWATLALLSVGRL